MLPGCRLLLIAAALLAAAHVATAAPILVPRPASDPVETVQGLEAGKICQVIRSCDFRRTAKVRGCLSSYSCRQCRFVKRCSAGRCEWQSVCSWGGA